MGTKLYTHSHCTHTSSYSTSAHPHSLIFTTIHPHLSHLLPHLSHLPTTPPSPESTSHNPTLTWVTFPQLHPYLSHLPTTPPSPGHLSTTPPSPESPSHNPTLTWVTFPQPHPPSSLTHMSPHACTHPPSLQTYPYFPACTTTYGPPILPMSTVSRPSHHFLVICSMQTGRENLLWFTAQPSYDSVSRHILNCLNVTPQEKCPEERRNLPLRRIYTSICHFSCFSLSIV